MTHEHDPHAELKEMRQLVNELLEEERNLNERIGTAVASGSLPLQWRQRRTTIREALEDCYAALPILEERVRGLTTVG